MGWGCFCLKTTIAQPYLLAVASSCWCVTEIAELKLVHEKAHVYLFSFEEKDILVWDCQLAEYWLEFTFCYCKRAISS